MGLRSWSSEAIRREIYGVLEKMIADGTIREPARRKVRRVYIRGLAMRLKVETDPAVRARVAAILKALQAAEAEAKQSGAIRRGRKSVGQERVAC